MFVCLCVCKGALVESVSSGFEYIYMYVAAYACLCVYVYEII